MRKIGLGLLLALTTFTVSANTTYLKISEGSDMARIMSDALKKNIEKPKDNTSSIIYGGQDISRPVIAIANHNNNSKIKSFMG